MTPTLLNNRYRVLQTLAAGGFGYTFLAEDTYMPSGRRCAIKQLKPISNNPQVDKLVQERFQREAAVLEALGEGNNQIPQLYAYFSEGGEFYLVQEWIEGDTLTNKVQKEGMLSESQVTAILLSLLPVLDYVHNYRIVHRDIKPDNIIIRKRDGLPVLIDFGAVKEAITTVANPQASTTQSMVIGTPGFMAAEQAAGRPIYASDLYSLGLVAVFLLTGKLPQSLEIDSGNGEILWRRDAPHCHSNLAGVVDRTIRFHPRDRFSTAREMLDTLKLNTESSEIATQSVPLKRYPIASNPAVPPTVPFKRKRYRFWHYPAAEEQKQLIAGGLVVGGWLLVAVAIALNFNRYQTTSNPVPSPTQTISELPTIKPSPSPIPALIPSSPLIAKPSVILPQSPEVTESPETSEIPSNPESTPIIAELPKVASTPKQATSSFSQLSSPLKTPQPKPLETPTPLAIPKPLATSTPLVTPTPSPTIEKNNPTHSQSKSIPAFAPGTSKKIVESSLGNPTKQSKGLWPKTSALLYEEFLPNKVSLGYLFDVNSGRLRQTEASFYQSVELETISDTLNQMLNGNITPEIQGGLARVYQRQSNRYRFITGNHLKVAIERNERDRIYIGVWEADLH
ncbi:protein kinase domain-containing protein [Limnofasciculus baicalensis]|uniref:non-specific serine/threonine protein kinase n=1 Tax=Limnofasciculus baicalensis BBK-W-15 TaxID=2699891 RepID=A0AAE3KKV6_9CYAN|nr:protein kinase [Limnofasciculus baicalensis]MCP2726976.1 protein kinase [Limnofasciculus baicalensis BBK-W-15]